MGRSSSAVEKESPKAFHATLFARMKRDLDGFFYMVRRGREGRRSKGCLDHVVSN